MISISITSHPLAWATSCGLSCTSVIIQMSCPFFQFSVYASNPKTLIFVFRRFFFSTHVLVSLQLFAILRWSYASPFSHRTLHAGNRWNILFQFNMASHTISHLQLSDIQMHIPASYGSSLRTFRASSFISKNEGQQVRFIFPGLIMTIPLPRKAAIRDSVGFEEVNQHVRNALVDWIGQAVRKQFQELVDAAIWQYDWAYCYYQLHGKILRSLPLTLIPDASGLFNLANLDIAAPCQTQWWRKSDTVSLAIWFHQLGSTLIATNPWGHGVWIWGQHAFWRVALQGVYNQPRLARFGSRVREACCSSAFARLLFRSFVLDTMVPWQRILEVMES